MKKIVLSLALGASLLMANESIFGEFGTPKVEKPTMFSADVGLWYITWDQTSTSSSVLESGVNPLDVKYVIDQAPAATLNLNFNWEFVSANMKYYNAKGANGLGFDVALLELIPFINLEARYVKANFKGDYSYTGYNNSTYNGSATFESPLEIIDIIVYPFNNYLGAGYRYNKIDTTANKATNTNNYSLMTEFNTEFHGPYVDVSMSF